MKTETIQTGKTSTGQLVRIQKRRGKFDVILNSTGYAWRYVLRSVPEQEARSEFFLHTI